MAEDSGVAPGGLLTPAAMPEVHVLGAGGLARRLAIGPLRELGLAIRDDEAVTVVDTLTEPDPAAPTDAGGESAAGVVGLLVNPTSEHWNAAAARRIPLVVLLLERPTDEGVVDAVLRGADAVVSAHDEPEDVIATLASVATGGTVLTPHQVRWVADAARGRRRGAAPVDSLTRRELDILLSIDKGETVKQTARSLGISAKTVENLQSRLFRKLAVRNRAQAVSRAHALGLLSVATGPDVGAALDLTATSVGAEARAR